MTPTRSKKGATFKSTAKSTTTKKLSRPTRTSRPPPGDKSKKETDSDSDDDDDDDEDEDEDEDEYETAQEDENWARVLKAIKASDSKRKTDARKKREKRLDDDMEELKTTVDRDMVPSDEDATRQRTKTAMLNLIAQMKIRSELEKRYLNTAEELHQDYLRINAELLLATKGRLEDVMKVAVIDIEP